MGVTTERGASCSSCGRGIWTSCCLIAWALVLFGTIVCHVAVKNLVPVLKELKGNIHTGFYQELGFDELEADSQKVKENAMAALALCGVGTEQCANLPSTTATADTSTQLAGIQAAFSSSLSKIDRVANDPYFGIDDLKSTGDNLREISDELSQLNNTNECAATNKPYCDIYSSADGLVNGTSEALKGVDALMNSEEVNRFADNADNLVLLHILPYPLLLSMLFFTCFWKKDAALCCCGGSCGGCILVLLHLIMWLVALVPSFIIVVIAWGFKFGQDKIQVPPPIKGDPTLGELLEHIQTAYPGFWDLVIVPLENPCNQLYAATFIIMCTCFFIGLYGSCLCLCRPYTDKAIA